MEFLWLAGTTQMQFGRRKRVLCAAQNLHQTQEHTSFALRSARVNGNTYLAG
jgi:hypothetical protein